MLREGNSVTCTWRPSSQRIAGDEQPGDRVFKSRAREQVSSIARRAIAHSANEEERGIGQTTLLGWSVSVVIHGLMLALAAIFNLHITLSPPVMQKAPFRWDVSLVMAPRTETVVADGVQSQAAFQAAESYPEEQVEQVTDSSAKSAASWQKAEIGQTGFLPEKKHQRMPDRENIIKSREGFKSATAMSVANADASVLPPPEIKSQTDSKLVQIETKLENPAVLQRPTSVTRTLVSKTVLPDYAWLMDSLRSKLERVKAYPPLAKANHLQGRVVVQVRVEVDGRVGSAEIEDSSGYPVLDRAALEALQAASPLTLKHGLENGSVVMLVPLNYQLE